MVYLDDFVDETFAKQVLDSIDIDDSGSLIGLKNRRVKHFGYEFRYGTNDCDPSQPLVNSPIPAVLDALFERLVSEGHISAKPDQMTVNVYEPGAGIPAHVDNTEAFEEFIVSLSLLSSVLMEFRRENEVARVLLKPNSLLVLAGDSRYKWTHGIAERKHDLLIKDKQHAGHVRVLKRAKRVSLTFRKIRLPVPSSPLRPEVSNDLQCALRLPRASARPPGLWSCSA